MYTYDLIVNVDEQKIHRVLLFKFIYNHEKSVQVPSANLFAKRTVRSNIFLKIHFREQIKFGLYGRFYDACPISQVSYQMEPCRIPSITYPFSVTRRIHGSVKSRDQRVFCRTETFDDVTQMKNGNATRFHLQMRLNPLMHNVPKWSDTL